MNHLDNDKATPPIFDSFSIKGVLKDAKSKLAKISDTPTLDAELLLANCLNKNQTYLHTWPEKTIDREQQLCFQQHINKRLDDYPVAYLLGEKAFWTLDLLVTPDVLIPRPETELLVEQALVKINKTKQPKILDLGTGSGAIALAIASERPDALIFASDHSKKALIIAEKNAIKNKLKNQINFIESNWFSNIKNQEFDLIVSNPPYIAQDDPHLSQTIRHEPISALTAKNNGLADIEIIIKNSTRFLKNNAWLIIEHGFDQSTKTQALLKQSLFTNINSHKDLNDIQRITLAQYHKSK